MDHPLRFGIGLWRREDTWPAILARVQRYEALGFDVVWVADTFVHPAFECWSLLAALARETRHVRIGPFVSHLIYRNPALLARMAMTVDHISDGRLDLGMGAGALEPDWTMTGGTPWPLAERAQRLREGVEIVDSMLREEVTSYDGRYYRVVEASMPLRAVQRPRPPLMIAAQGPVTVRLTAQYGDIWSLDGNFWNLDPESATDADIVGIARGLSERLDAQAVAFDRDPRAITRSILAGFKGRPSLTVPPWTSPDAFREFVGRYREWGFSEFVVPEPDSDQEVEILAGIARDVFPELRNSL